MTSNNALKKKAREHAAKTGVSFTQARREILAQILSEPEMVRWVQIQQAMRDDNKRPMPFTMDHFGFVASQDFWRGDPWRLIGFVVDPDMKTIDLQREDFLANPEQAIGMHPVFMDRTRSYATWRGAVEEVETREKPLVDPDSVRAEFYVRTPAGEHTATMGVAHVLHGLSLDEIVQMRDAGWGSTPASEELLSLLCMTGDDKALDFSSHMDDVDEEDLAFNVHVVAEEAEAWLTSGRGR